MAIKSASVWIIALMLAAATPARAQDSAPLGDAPAPVEAPALRRKSVAVALAVLPGAGHVYAGEPRRATLTFGTFALGLFLVGRNAGAGGLEPCPPPTVDPNATGGCGEQNEGSVHLGVAGLAVSAGSWLYSVLDAAPAAERSNRRTELRTRGAQPAPWLAIQRNGSAAIGLSLAGF